MGLFSDIFDGAVDLVTAPIEVAKDVVTLGGLATGRSESYTEERLHKLVEDAEDVLDDL
jgi:hypothetical protein